MRGSIRKVSGSPGSPEGGAPEIAFCHRFVRLGSQSRGLAQPHSHVTEFGAWPLQRVSEEKRRSQSFTVSHAGSHPRSLTGELRTSVWRVRNTSLAVLRSVLTFLCVFLQCFLKFKNNLRTARGKLGTTSWPVLSFVPRFVLRFAPQNTGCHVAGAGNLFLDFEKPEGTRSR